LRFVNCLKSQLLIGHCVLPIKIVDQSPLVAHQKPAWMNRKSKIKSILGNNPRLF
jgi:hypothetical protein